METTPRETTDLAASIADLLTGALARQPRIGALTRLSGGASRETWSFGAEIDGATRALILRRDPPGRPSEPGAMDLEARLLRACRAAGLAVPDLVAVDDGTLLGTPGIVMSRVAGETLARRIQRDQQFAGARTVLARQCGEFVAGLQRIPIDEVPGLPDLDALDHYRQRWRELNGVSPTFELALRWLDQHRPAAGHPVIVHGDFRLGNFVVADDGLAAVLDWELAHVGDPLEDLAWLCIKAWRFRARLPVGGVGRFEELVGGYQAEGGQVVEPDAFRWWLVFNSLKWGVICEWQAAAHLTGAQRSVELAAIGRRVAEQEWDLLELLDPEACRRALERAQSRGFDVAPPEDVGVYGRPTATELLEAAREFVTDEVMPATRESGAVQFHSRVAAHVLAMVARQVRLAPGQSVRHRAALDALGVADIGELAGAVRVGAWDDRGLELQSVLAAVARDKLAIAEPRHLTIPSAAGEFP
ncbi:MAG TPA: phosphotransferase family protein [Ilumatobacter sp.]|nr:phosphotransferase family protein [Ilumatobacter sp.]